MAEIPKPIVRWVLYWTVVACVMLVVLASSSLIRRVHAFYPTIISTARAHGLPPAVVSAVIWKESRYDPTARGDAGEVGLMQITEGAAADWASAHPESEFQFEHLWNPHTNIVVGSWYLARAVEYWAGNDYPDPLPFALAEYNAGRGNAIRWAETAGTDPEAFAEAITFATTREYIQDVLERSRGGL